MKPYRPDREERDRRTGHRLKMAREMTRLGPDRAWREAGVAPRLLEMYEQGIVPISIEHLAALSRCMDIPLAWLSAEGELNPADAVTFASLMEEATP